MPEIDTIQKRRFSYVLSDIEQAKQIGNGLNAHEILLDYEKNDLLIIDSELNEWSLQSYIKNIADGLLPNSHIKSDNQHLLATETTDGFMSSEVYNMVYDIYNNINSINKKINLSIQNSPFIVDELDYSIQDNMFVIDELLINNGGFILNVNDMVELVSRGDNNRTEIIYLLYDSFGYDIGYSIDCDYNDSYIRLGTEIYYYDVKKHVYINNDMYILPIIMIDRLSKFKSDNMFISDAEICDITRRKLPNKDSEIIIRDHIVKNKLVSKVLKTNLKTDYTKAICYIPFNGNDSDIISSQSLNKYASYTESPYGKMMCNASDEGDYVSFKHDKIFTVEFLINLDIDIMAENLISLYDNNNLEETVNIQLVDNEIIAMNANNKKIQCKCNKGYNFIQLKITPENISLYINNEIKDSIDVVASYDKIRVTSLYNNIGELIISNNDTFIHNNEINIVPTFRYLLSDDISINKKTSFNIYNKNDDFNLLLERKNANNLSKKDRISIMFNHDIADIYNNVSSILNIRDNKLTLDKNNFNINDTIVVFNSSNELYKIYNIIDILDDSVLVDDIILDDIIGFNVSRITDTLPVKLNVSDIELNNIIKRNNSINVILDKDYSNDTNFNLNYKKKIYKNKLYDDIHNINKVKVDGVELQRRELNNISFNKSDFSCIFNGSYMDTSFNNNEIVSFSDNNVDVCYKIRLTDFIDVKDMDIEIIRKFIDFNIKLEVATNIGSTLYINDIEYHTDNYIELIYIDRIDISDDYDISIHMRMSSEQINTLIIRTINLDMTFNSIDSFYSKDINNTISQFVIMNSNGIFTNINDLLEINYSYEVDDFTINESNLEQLSTNYNGLHLVENSANIVYVSDNNRLYRLDKKYVR